MRRLLPFLALLLLSCASFDAAKLREVDAAVNEAVAGRKIPGGVLLIERDGERYVRAYGNRALVPAVEAMTADTIFDAASLTKVTATAPSIWLLIERGRLGLDDTVQRYLPEFGDPAVTLRHLLTHTSGLKPGIEGGDWSGYDEGIRRALAETPRNRPGAVFRYSDVNFILLGEIVRRVSGEPLDVFAGKNIFEPLGMKDTGFRPVEDRRSRLSGQARLPVLHRIAPTEDGLRGVVHDPTTRRMGGVAGHAGMFTTAADLAKFARAILRGGFFPRGMTEVASPPEVAVRRMAGFDVDSNLSRPRGDLFPAESFGHTGWTGGFLWIVPSARTFYVFLSNRVHPDGRGSVVALQRTLGTRVAESLGVPFTPQPRRVGYVTGGADAQNGIDVLHNTGYAALRGLRVGLITNSSAIDRAGNPSVDLLRSAPGVTLTAIFSPEHGFRAVADDKVADESYRGIPVFSLYGERRKPTASQLENVDALVFDIQDIGTRFYTYISTMGLAMEAAAEAKKKFIVLDRVNPIGGTVIEGPVLEGETNFVGWHPLPVRHGKTVGELARMFRDERGIKVDLTVVEVRGWKREQWQDEAGLPWINTSPNMRSLDAAALYPGLGLLERAVSVGRGTSTPFELLGAPYIDGTRLAAEVRVPGVQLTPIRFTPTASTHANQECGGIRVTITDRRALRSVDLGVSIASALARLYPQQFPVDELQPLLRHHATLEAIRAGKPLEEIQPLWGVVLHDATVIDGTGAAPRVADVVIRGDRIERVDASHQHEGFRVVDSRGRYAIPGLIDMHAHVMLDRPEPATLDWTLRMLLANGVTTVRDPGSPTAETIRLRGEKRGPRLFTAGNILNASNFNPGFFQPVFTADAVRAEVRAQAAAGVDAIKVYSSMPPELVRVAVDEAHAHRLPTIGHLQRTTWGEAAAAGIDALEHAAPWTNDLTTTECPPTMLGRVCWIESYDFEKARALARVLAGKGVFVDPTLIAMQTKFWPDAPRDYAAVPEALLAKWRAGAFTRDWKPEEFARAQRAWPRLLAFTKLLHDEGVQLTAGTDTPTPWIVPGLSLHEELQYLRDAGIPPLEVIRIATHNAALALRRSDLGTLATGKRADLVLLAGNPLDDIANTRTIVLVMKDGVEVGQSRGGQN